MIKSGAPHFRALRKQYSHSNYTLEKSINEFIDNIIKKQVDVIIYTRVSEEGDILRIDIKDNFYYGFADLELEGEYNPFNMGHINISHDNDDETSEFGIGMKAAAISTANNLTVYTKVRNVCYKIDADFIRMAEEKDVNDSYNSFITQISEEEYLREHQLTQVREHQLTQVREHQCGYDAALMDAIELTQGSTISLTNIKSSAYTKCTQEAITEKLINGIKDTYSQYIRAGSRIIVNGKQVEPEYNYFTDERCEPFNIHKKIYCFCKEFKEEIYCLKNLFYIFDQKNNKWEKITLSNGIENFIREKEADGYILEDTIDIISTITMYSNHNGELSRDIALPRDIVEIYKDDRKYANKSLKGTNNGAHNYTIHCIKFKSKKIGKKLGITFNKDITLENENIYINAIKSAIKDNRSHFSCDTSTETNRRLCEKAIALNLINIDIFPNDKLHKSYRRYVHTPVLEMPKGSVPAPVDEIPKKPKSEKIKEPILEPVDEIPKEPASEKSKEPISAPVDEIPKEPKSTSEIPKESVDEIPKEPKPAPVDEILKEPKPAPVDEIPVEDVTDKDTINDDARDKLQKVINILSSKLNTPIELKKINDLLYIAETM